MKQYNMINSCLSNLKSSRMDGMTKLRMENLLIGMKMLLLVDVEGQEAIPGLEELFTHVNEVCSGESADGLNNLVDQVRRMKMSMAESLNLNC